eukprot:gene14012-17125_t
MNLYIATRWGNPNEKSGPDGKDTNFLVRAASVGEAALLADAVLHGYPTSAHGNRPVVDFVSCVRQIGDDPRSSMSAVIHGPWIEYIAIEHSDYDVWHRDESQ